MEERTHDYRAVLVWAGNTGTGTASYSGYERRFRVLVHGKPELAGSADPSFRGEADRHDPEDLFLAAVAACHMLSYLALCARRSLRVVAYEDEAQGRMRLDGGGGGRFEEVRLRPRVTIDEAGQEPLALQLHAEAHDRCFIANSCSVPIRHEPVVIVAAGPGGGA